MFRIRNDVTLTGLKDDLDQINRQLNHRDTRRVVCVEYRCQLSDSAGSLRFSRMKLTNDNDVGTMFSVFEHIFDLIYTLICTTQHMPMVFDNEVDVEPGSFAWLHGVGFAC
ncbi:hypothetical protein MTR_1g112390 [Medicago truncatula]|uniref:Uncharacterized protein n=1 Tax=Medicago truncatula TaxID=3880 RepID=A0A072VQS6_MEDTR|nr:hypothetical protein MTR_1g112390 [Medicago truncatula]